MPGKFIPIADLFNQDVVGSQGIQNTLSEKPWELMTQDEKLENLLTYCLRSDVFSRSRPEFDVAWFEKVHRSTSATMDDLKIVLLDCEGFMMELIERSAFNYKDVRRHVIYRLKKYLAYKAFLAKKKQSHNTPVQRIPAKIELPKEQFCPKCMRYLPRDFFTLDGICVDCGEQECDGCHRLFKNKELKRRKSRFYCQTCFEK